ncbi:vomeronasal type-2 receptor, partial [Cricetulus griseus]
IPNLVCAFGNSECYFRIKDFSHDGNVMIGAFFPLYYYYTNKKIPHKNLPNHYEDLYLQSTALNFMDILNVSSSEGLLIKNCYCTSWHCRN